jgi:hypothetical protein
MGLATAVVAVPMLRSITADAADLPHLAESDATAKALGYVENASKIDPAKEAAFKKGSHCAGCALYQGGTAAFGPCAAFPGKSVSAKGWCRAYAAKA